MFNKIRKYKAFYVIFFAITFLLYSKGFTFIQSTKLIEKDKKEALSFINASAIITGSCFTQNLERLHTNNTSLVKKVSIDRHIFWQVIVGIKYLQQIDLKTCVIIACSPSVLDLNSILII